MTAHHFQSFGEQLRRYRRDRGLTQEALAEAAGLSARGIRALEQGERTAPHVDTVQLLADALELFADERARFAGAARRIAGAERSGGEPAPSLISLLGPRSSGPPMVREDDVTQALRLLEEVKQGGGRLILVAGEAGIILGGDGVSALLDRYWGRRAAS
jgi:transcriptional regulator with XRE-family HTH domain